MTTAPDRCLYCDGTDPNCGFCDMGVPLDSQEDWDRTWGVACSGADWASTDYQRGREVPK